jgi:hypothetical protein
VRRGCAVPPELSSKPPASTAIEKADSYCQTDANRPDSGTYKAILVDGIVRDAL